MTARSSQPPPLQETGAEHELHKDLNKDYSEQQMILKFMVPSPCRCGHVIKSFQLLLDVKYGTSVGNRSDSPAPAHEK